LLTLFNLRPDTPNIGNHLMAAGMWQLIEPSFAEPVSFVTLPSIDRKDVRGGGLTARTVYELNQLADGVIIGPGNLFENGALSIDGSALAALNVPTMMFGVSCGRIFDRSGKLVRRTDSLSPEAIEAMCRKSDVVLVRDLATHAYAHALGVASASLGGCAALFIDPARVPLRLPDPKLADTVLISVRNPRLMSVPYSIQGRIYQDVRRLIDNLRAEGHDVRLLCHDHQDLAFARAFSDIRTMYTEDVGLFLSWLRDCRMSIGYRLHAFVASLALGKRAIALSYDERSMSLIETIGLKDWDVDILSSKDPVSDVAERCGDFARLDTLLGRARPTWGALRNVLSAGVAQFASRVEAWRERRVF
jgi:polysaccharide pyruvyl transferase WcaK-like protein